MTLLSKQRFEFLSSNLPADTFSVVEFKGEEGLSQSYLFEITLVSNEAELDLDQILNHQAVFSMTHEDGKSQYHGIVVHIDQLQQFENTTFFQAVLAPRLYWLNLTRHNQVFLNQAIPDILEAILKDAWLTSLDYELVLQERGQYRTWDIFCQYQQTHFDMFSYWAERMGMYYFFEQSSDREKVVIVDHLSVHRPLSGDSSFYFRPPSGLSDQKEGEKRIESFVCRQHLLPQKVLVKDYDYLHPTKDLTSEAVVSPQGFGQVYLYRDQAHFQSREEGENLAKIRAEEMLCRKKVFSGTGQAANLRPGFTFRLHDHYRRDFNQDYLVIQVTHQGNQSGFLIEGLRRHLGAREGQVSYRNEFKAIPADVQFRPARNTPEPKIWGTFNAVIDAAGSGKYAELDEHGRYKVILPFDLSGRKGLKASAWLRMTQPFTGADHGMHFPLHKGTEVLLSFIAGDPNIPVIVGAVPNPANPSVVTSANSTMSGIQTAGGNTLHMEDKEGSQRIVLKTGGSGSVLKMGHGSPNTEFFLGSDFVTSNAGFVSSEFCGLNKTLCSMAKSTTLTGSIWAQALMHGLNTFENKIPGLIYGGTMLGLEAGGVVKDKSLAQASIGLGAQIALPLFNNITALITKKVNVAILKKKLLPVTGMNHSFAYSVINHNGATLVEQQSKYAGTFPGLQMIKGLAGKLEAPDGMLFFEGEGDQIFYAKKNTKIAADEAMEIKADKKMLLLGQQIGIFDKKESVGGILGLDDTVDDIKGSIHLRGSGKKPIRIEHKDKRGEIQLASRDVNVLGNSEIYMESKDFTLKTKDQVSIDAKTWHQETKLFMLTIKDDILIKCGKNSISLDSETATMKVGSNKIEVTKTGVKINGNKLKVSATGVSITGNLDVTGKVTSQNIRGE